jgi:hypothetical protein
MSIVSLDAMRQAYFRDGKAKYGDIMFYYAGPQLAAVRYKNWKWTYLASEPGAAGWLEPLKVMNFLTSTTSSATRLSRTR